MAATRPSRQQLQLSASTSDTANCAEFSNLEIQREEMIYPPFRHRGLPNLPRSCHPSCDANWNCPNCSSCHPLMGFGHADQYYSHAYSAVYEAIDDFDEEDNEKTENADEILSREVTTIILQPDELHPSCSPCEGLPPEINSDQLQSRPADDKKYVQKVAETGFNGVEHAENVPTSTLPKYFDLKHNSAISRPYDSIIHNHHLQNPSIVSNTTEYCNSSYLNCGHHSILPTQCEYPMLANSPLHSFVMSQVHNKVIPSASELYMPKTGRESSTRYVVDGINNDQHKTSNILSTAYCKGHTDRSLMQLGDRLSYTNSDPNMQQKQRRLDLHNSKKSNPTFANIPCQSLCPGCQQDSLNYFTDQQNIPPSNKK